MTRKTLSDEWKIISSRRDARCWASETGERVAGLPATAAVGAAVSSRWGRQRAARGTAGEAAVEGGACGLCCRRGRPVVERRVRGETGRPGAVSGWPGKRGGEKRHPSTEFTAKCTDLR